MPSTKKSSKQQELSIYVHWPFCRSKCPYCDFNSHVAASAPDQQNFLAGYLRQIDFFTHLIKGKKITSIFFGGGTPSLMSAFVPERIIEHVGLIASIDKNTEITIEANPTSYEAGKFQDFKLAGINRVSIGVQSLRDEILAFLRRQHSAGEARRAVSSASKIFDNISFDLIYAVRGQTLSAWRGELQEALSMANQHISLYQLTIERGTEFHKMYRKGQLKTLDNDTSEQMYSATIEHLARAGYMHYEISNFAKSSALRCSHNMRYWQYKDYLGIGPGAHSRIMGEDQKMRSIMMIHHPNRWLEGAMKESCAMQTDEYIRPADGATEMLMMGTRIPEGVDVAALEKIAKKPLDQIIDIAALDEYVKLGLAENNQSNIALTKKGMLLHSYILSRIIL